MNKLDFLIEYCRGTGIGFNSPKEYLSDLINNLASIIEESADPIERYLNGRQTEEDYKKMDIYLQASKFLYEIFKDCKNFDSE